MGAAAKRNRTAEGETQPPSASADKIPPMSEQAGGGSPGPRGASLEARALSRSFGDHRALDALDLSIAPGEAFGLLGANGAGKTTFLRLVTGYLLPTAGEITVDGVSPSRDARAVTRRLGFVAETTRLYPELRVRAFLRFVAGARGLPKALAHERVEASLARFDLAAVAGRPIGHLSKGFQQRVNLAQGFLHDPALLLVDEPTSGLDPLQQAEVRAVLRGLRGARTLLLCTHDLGEARELTERVAVLHKGRLVALGPTAEVLGAGDPLALFRGEGRAA
jgi:ABC-2 type transport system ATP-binding protein